MRVEWWTRHQEAAGRWRRSRRRRTQPEGVKKQNQRVAVQHPFADPGGQARLLKLQPEQMPRQPRVKVQGSPSSMTPSSTQAGLRSIQEAPGDRSTASLLMKGCAAPCSFSHSPSTPSGLPPRIHPGSCIARREASGRNWRGHVGERTTSTPAFVPRSMKRRNDVT